MSIARLNLKFTDDNDTAHSRFTVKVFEAGTRNPARLYSSSGSLTSPVGLGETAADGSFLAYVNSGRAYDLSVVDPATNFEVASASGVSTSSGKTGNVGTSAVTGGGNTSSGANSVVAGGGSNKASGASSSVPGGSNNTASGSLSFAHGSRAVAAQTGKWAYSSGMYAASGDSQVGLMVLRGYGAAVAVDLSSDGLSTSTANQLIVATNQTLVFTGVIAGKKAGTTNVGAWKIEGVLVNNGGTVTLASSSVTAIGTPPAGWSVPALSADNVKKCLKITSGFLAATNILWTARVDSTELTF